MLKKVQNLLLKWIFDLIFFLIKIYNDDDVIMLICEELLAMQGTDKFIIGRSNCPICGEDFYPGEWNCNCFEEEDQDRWFRFVDYITFKHKGYSHIFYKEILETIKEEE